MWLHLHSIVPRVALVALILSTNTAWAGRRAESDATNGTDQPAPALSDDPDWDAPAADALGDSLDADPDGDLGGDPDGDLDADPAGDLNGLTDHADTAPTKAAGSASLDADPAFDDPIDFEKPAPLPAANPAPKPTPAAAAPEAAPTLDLSGKLPLADNFPARIVSHDIDSVVVELPVLVARGGTDFNGESYWLDASFYVAGTKVAETRELVSSTAVAPLGPTVAWLKSSVPVPNARGRIEVHVSQVPYSGDADPKPLFTKVVNYAL